MSANFRFFKIKAFLKAKKRDLKNDFGEGNNF